MTLRLIATVPMTCVIVDDQCRAVSRKGLIEAGKCRKGGQVYFPADRQLAKTLLITGWT